MAHGAADAHERDPGGGAAAPDAPEPPLAAEVLPDAPTLAADPEDPIVQYILLRTDLGWPMGAGIAQCCHASTAALALWWSDPLTRAYVADLDRMHKVVLEAPTDKALLKVHGKLEAGGVDHKLWIEQPEGVPTALATKPNRKSVLAAFFRGLKLLK